MKCGMLVVLSQLRPADDSKYCSLQESMYRLLSNGLMSDGWEQMLQAWAGDVAACNKTDATDRKRRASEWMA